MIYVYMFWLQDNKLYGEKIAQKKRKAAAHSTTARNTSIFL